MKAAEYDEAKSILDLAVRDDKPTFAEATRIIHNETNPYNARGLAQRHGRRAIVCNKPALPISSAAMDSAAAKKRGRGPTTAELEPWLFIPAHASENRHGARLGGSRSRAPPPRTTTHSRHERRRPRFLL